MIKNRKIFVTNLFFLVIGLLLFLVQIKGEKVGILTTQYGLILIPSIIFALIMEDNVKTEYKFRKISFKQKIYIILIMICSYPIGVFLNMLVLFGLEKFGVEPFSNSIFITSNLKDYIIALLLFCLTPGICEEFMFRGSILSAYKSLGEKKGILITAILFGLFHFNLQNLLGPIFLGVVLGFLRLRTNSIYSPMLGHTVNNMLAITIGFATNTYYSGEIQERGRGLVTGTEMLKTIGVFGLIALFFLILVLIFFMKMPGTDRIFDSNHIEDVGIIEFIPLVIILIWYIYVNQLMFFPLLGA